MGFDGVSIGGSGYRVFRSFSVGLKPSVDWQSIKIQTYETEEIILA